MIFNSVISNNKKQVKQVALSKKSKGAYKNYHIAKPDKFLFANFLADRTDGRAYATVLRLSSVCRLSSVTLCIVTKRCVVEQKLLLRAYRKSYMRNRLVPK